MTFAQRVTLAHLSTVYANRLRKESSAENVHALADAALPQFTRIFLGGFDALADAVDLDDLAHEFSVGTPRQVLESLPWDRFSEIRPRIQDSITALVVQVGAREAERIGLSRRKQGPPPAAVTALFNLTNERVYTWIEQYTAQMVVQVNNETRQAIREIITQAFKEGLHPYDSARLVRQSIGLTAFQARAVENFRRGMIEAIERGGGPKLVEALRRRWTLSPVHYPGQLRRERVDEFAQKYRKRLLKWRSENIARTETLRASHMGRQSIWREAVAQGLISPDSQRRWVTTKDDRLCFPAKTRVLTLDGWKPISQVEVGQFVLTHKDRFRRVVATRSLRYDGMAVRLHCSTGTLSVTATYGHPFLTENGWVPVEELNPGDRVYVLARPCVDCHTGLIPYGPARQWAGQSGGVCASCKALRMRKGRWLECEDRSAANRKRWSDPAQHAQASERFKGDRSPAKREGVRRRISQSVKRYYEDQGNREQARARNRRTADSDPNWGWKDPQRRAAALRKAAQARGRNSRGQSFLERKVRWFLEQQGIEFEAQWAYQYNGRIGFADFYLPGPQLVIECDGYFHSLPEAIENDREKTQSLERQGYTVLRFTEEEIRYQFASVASAIRSYCCFTLVEVTEVVRKEIKYQPVYDLQVEDDESFVAAGFVVHNCPICRPMDGQMVALEGQFEGEYQTRNGTAKLTNLTPPIHSQCRCHMELVAFDPVAEKPPPEPGADIEQASNFLHPDVFPLAGRGGLPLARGASWADLSDPNAREVFLDLVRKNPSFYKPDFLISEEAVEELLRIATDPRFQLRDDLQAYFGISETWDTIRQVSMRGDLLRMDGVRSMAFDLPRATGYAGSGGTTFEVVLPKGTRAGFARVFDLPEIQVLPGSTYKIVSATAVEGGGTHVVLRMVDDGTRNVIEIARFKRDLALAAGLPNPFPILATIPEPVVPTGPVALTAQEIADELRKIDEKHRAVLARAERLRATARERLDFLKRAGNPAADRALYAAVDAVTYANQRVARVKGMRRRLMLKAIEKATGRSEPGKLDVKIRIQKELKKKVEEGVEIFQRLIPQKYYQNQKHPMTFRRIEGRAYYQRGADQGVHIARWDDIGIIIHEMGHGLDDISYTVREATRDFLKRRTQGETAQKLRDLLKNKGYDNWEVSRPDAFFHAYVGKVYGYGAWTTEVTSMGLEQIWRDPLVLIDKDFEHFELMWKIITGTL